MTNHTPHGQVPEALRLAEMLTADEWPGSVTLVSYARECVAELRRLHAENERLSCLCDKWNSECDELREDNKRLAAALARTVMLDQVSFDRKPDCYGIRQITDDEGVEEWEDIRTSPDVAHEEANDMMATGRGEIYEVVPLWTTPQHSPTAQAAESVSVLPDFDTVEQHIYGACRRYITRDMLEPIHNLIRDAIDVDRAARGAAQAAPAYKDSTPELHVGESSFEGWFSEYDPAGKGDKQRARDAYAAGMGDPLVTAQPAPVAEDADPLQGAANWLVTSQTITSATTLGGRLCIGYNRAERLFNAARAQAAQPEGGNHG